MELQQEFSANNTSSANPSPGADPRLMPTPDYGTLGPGSDLANSRPANNGSANKSQLAMLVALSISITVALLVGSVGKARSAWSSPDRAPVSVGNRPVNSRNIDQLQPQKQAEALLELAVGNSDEAVDQISSRVDGWHGELVWDSQIASLTTAALNSKDIRVRQSGIEVELAAYGLGKNSASLNYLLKTADSSDHAQKIWALWALGLIANRGVEPARIVHVLSMHLQDSDVDSRRRAIDGLALTGSDTTIPLLLGAMHDGSSPVIREEAAYAIAQSGMFTHVQRMSAIPRLLNFTDDSSLDAQTHAWAFQALGDITGEHLPNDAAAWRNWYENRN
jgi:HEAT repeat protein